MPTKALIHYGNPDHHPSYFGLFVSDHRRVIAKRAKRRYCCRLWRHGQSDGIWAAWRCYSINQGDDLVCRDFHDYVDHAVGYGFTKERSGIGAGELQIATRQDAAGEARTATKVVVRCPSVSNNPAAASCV